MKRWGNNAENDNFTNLTLQSRFSNLRGKVKFVKLHTQY
jgi:hypothetical protein